MKIYLIRHGETTGDVEDRYGGDYDDHLSDKGKEQAVLLAEQLKSSEIRKIFTSPLIRAKETTEYLKKVLNVESEVVEDLRERNQYGKLTGMVKAEALENYPDLVEGLKDFHNTIEGAESYESFKQRVLAALEKITQADLECIAIVTHGGPIKAILRMLLNQEEIKDIKDCGFIVIDYENVFKILDDQHLYRN